MEADGTASAPEVRGWSRKKKIFAWAIGAGLAGCFMLIALGLLITFLLPRIPDALDAAEVTGCKKSLQQFFTMASDYERSHGALPAASGEAFFEAIAEDQMSAFIFERFGCPADKSHAGRTENRYRGFAFRDNVAYPARIGDRDRALAACGNRGGQNHDDITNVLMADGSIVQMSLATLKELGTVRRGDESLIVGEDSPVPMLRELRQ